MGDPLSDPRAADLLSADPAEVWGLASLFGRVAGEAASIAGALRGAAHDATWTGAAADAFRQNLGALPGELEQVRSSYQEVAGALDAYEGELASVKPAFQRLAEQLGNASSSLVGAEGQLAGAQSSLTSALSAPHAKSTSPAVLSAHDAVAAASGAVGRLQGELSGLESRGFALLDRFQLARDSCQAKVSGACSIAPHQSWWDYVLGDVGNWMSDAGHFLFSVGKGIVDGVTGLPGALVDFVEHPSWATFGKLAEDVAITASVVLLFTGVGELLLPEEAAGALALDAASDAAGAVAKGAMYGAAAAEGGQAGDDLAHGEYAAAGARLGEAGLDVLVMQLPELGDALPASRAAESAAERAGALEQFSALRDAGQNPVQALNAMSEEDRSLVLESAKDGPGSMLELGRQARLSFLATLENPTDMVEQAELRAKLLQIASLPGKVSVNFAADHVVIDPLTKAGEDRIAQAGGIGAGCG